ncbi:MAG: DUF2927 domain-containing protein [Loktanella sp.]|nr:DUF2927 domain-containing protein [Loktanella sp.]
MTKAKMPVDIRQSVNALRQGGFGCGTTLPYRSGATEARRRLGYRVAVFALTFVASCTPTQQAPEATRAVTLDSALPPMQMFTDATPIPATRTNTEMAEDFLDLAFRLESGKVVPVLTRFEGPITVRIAGPASEPLRADLSQLLGRLRREAGLDISLTDAPTANVTIEAVPQAALQRAVPHAACFVVPRLTTWSEFLGARNTPLTDWTTLKRRDRVAMFVPADAAPQEIRDCLHEELAQGLGPLNDLYRLPDSVFNDDNIHAVLTGFDMLMLQVYYHPRLRNGMTRAEAAAVVPGILASLNPAGERAKRQAGADTSRDWADAMETALSNGASPGARRSSAARAVSLAQRYGWRGIREAFAQYAYGRLLVGFDRAGSIAAFNAAERIYQASPITQIHTAHIAVQKAAYALGAGDAQATLELARGSIPIARQHQNAALMSTLMMFEAEALDMIGNSVEAEAVRLDSLGWARYGFGTDINVQDRLNEVASLRPY